MPAGADIRAGRAYIELLLNDSKFVRGLRHASQRLTSFGGGIAKIGAGVAAMGGAILGVISSSVVKFAAVGDELDKMSARTGVSAGSLAELGFAAEQSGASLQTVEKGLFGLSRAYFDAARGGKASIDALKEIGLTAEDLKGKLPEEQFQMVADGLAHIEDAAVRGAVAQKLLGRSGRELLPMLEGLRALRQETRDLGLAPTDKAVKDAAAVTDAFNRVRRTIGAVVFEIGASLADTVLEAADTLTTIVVSTGKWVRENHSLVVTIAKLGALLLAAGTAISALGGAVIVTGLALSGLTTILGVVGTVLGAITSPIGLITGALAAGVVLWARYTESGQAAVETLASGLQYLLGIAQQVFGGISDAVMSGDLALAGQIALAGLKVVLLDGLTALAETVSGELGNLLGTIGSQLAAGDLSGAWTTMLERMHATWSAFSEGLVNVFTSATRAITGVWERVTTWISQKILSLAGSDTVLGGLVSSVLGVDLAAEQRRSEELNRQASSMGLATGPGAIEAAQQAAGQQIGGQADAFRARLDAIDANARQQTLDAQLRTRTGTAGGVSEAAQAADDAAAELEQLTAQAARLRDEQKQRDAARGQETAAAFDGVGTEGLKREVFGTFSAAALSAQAGGMDPQREQLRELQNVRKSVEKSAVEQEKTRRALERGLVVS